MSCKDVIKSYLYHKCSFNVNKVAIIPSYKIETELVDYGRNKFNKLYSPSTYSRTFREIRENDLFKDEFEIKIEKVHPVHHYNYFIVKQRS